HMSLNALPKVRPVGPAEEAPASGGFSVQITPVYGITMPIIVRKGALHVTAGLANPQLEARDRGAAFAVDITRNGSASIYGDLLVYRRGVDEPVFVARGLGVYPEIASRHAAFALSADQAAAMRGAVRIEFREPV